jgi:DNA-binding response OmpR family regulator
MFAQTQRPRIFCCIDDNGETCVRLTEKLNLAGGLACDVISAREAKSALWWARNERFDLYILDKEFPDGSGLELCRKLREVYPHTPIIFYSEDAGDSESRLAGISAGAQAYLVKPDVEELAVVVLRLLDGRGQVAA